MKLAFVSDPHCGNHRRFGGEILRGMNKRCRDTLAALEKAVVHAQKSGCDALIVNGDLFDTSKPEPPVLTRVLDILMTARHPPEGWRQMAIVLLVGNHDQQSDGEGDHALGPLKYVARIVEGGTTIRLKGVRDGDECDLICLPYRAQAAKDWLPGALAAQAAPRRTRSADVPRVLSVHLGIADDATPPWLKDARDAVHVDMLTELCVKHDVDAAFAGNWHDHVTWDGEPLVMQVGALTPTGWDNPGLEGYGGVAVYDTELKTANLHTVPGARFCNASSADELRDLAAKAKAGGHTLYARVNATRATAPGALGDVETLQKAGEVAGAEVVLDKAETEAAARSAAEQARSAETLGESLTAYVRAMPLEPGVDADAVIARSVKYLTFGAS